MKNRNHKSEDKEIDQAIEIAANFADKLIGCAEDATIRLGMGIRVLVDAYRSHPGELDACLKALDEFDAARIYNQQRMLSHTMRILNRKRK